MLCQLMLFSALKEWARPLHMAMNRGGNTETLKESKGDNDDQKMIQALEKACKEPRLVDFS